MSSTRNAILCALAALLTLSAVPVAEARIGRSACANRLCTETDPGTESCWKRDGRARIARCFIVRAARHYRQPRSQAIQIAWRESRFRWRVTNRSSGAAGLYQFMPRTWRYTPYRRFSPYHPRWAALAAMWMWRKGYQSHWSTY